MNIDDIPDAFPALFRMQSTWIMSVENGLYQVLYDLCAEIERLSIDAGLKRTDTAWPEIMNISMSNGNLSMDFYSADKELDRKITRAIYDAGIIAESTCEECGQAGTLQRDYRSFCVICDACLTSRTKRLSSIRHQLEAIRRGEK